MKRYAPFNNSLVNMMSKSIGNMKGGRLRMTDRLSMDLHEKKTSKLKECRDAAVLVSLCNVKGVPSLLYTVRSMKLRSHSGHVSFPGGGVDPGETMVETALRETHEEIGIEPKDVSVIGLGQTVFSITGVLVTPVIGLITPDLDGVDWASQSSLDEVDTVFTRPLHLLADKKYSTIETLTRKGVSVDMPVYGLESDGSRGKETIWGLSAMLTEATVGEILHHID